MATGRKNGLSLEVYGSRGVALRSTSSGSTSCRCSTVPATAPSGARRVVVTESRTIRTSAPGGRPATCSAGTTRSPRRRPTSSTAIGAGERPRRRRSPTGSRCSGCWRRSRRVRQPRGATRRRTEGLSRGLMGKRFTLFTGQWADLTLEEVAGLAAGWGYDGLEIAVSGEHLDAWRWDERRATSRSGSRSWRSTASAAGRSATTSPGRRSATTRSTTATRRSSASGCGATAIPEGVRSAPRRR